MFLETPLANEDFTTWRPIKGIVSKVHPYLGLCDGFQLNHVSILSSVVSRATRDAGPLPADISCDPSEPHCTQDHPVP
jgi:hypothetical protein